MGPSQEARWAPCRPMGSLGGPNGIFGAVVVVIGKRAELSVKMEKGKRFTRTKFLFSAIESEGQDKSAETFPNYE